MKSIFNLEQNTIEYSLEVVFSRNNKALIILDDKGFI